MPSPPSAWQRIKLGRKNILAVWEAEAFAYEFVSTQFFTRRAFLCNSPDAVQFAFGSHNESFERKSPAQRFSLLPLLGDGLFISDGDVWRRRRRIVNPIIHVSRLPEFAPVMVESIIEVRDRWATLPAPGDIDALGEMARLTAEILSRTIFGRQLGHEHASVLVESFSEYQRHIGQIDLLSLLGFPDWMPRWYSARIRRSVRRIHALLDDIIEGLRVQNDRDDKSIVGRLLNARDRDTGAPLDAKALRNEIAVLFMAGHETTANTLAWTWYLLSQSPEAEARLHREVDGVLGGRPPTLADVPKLIYTRAVFEEAMRLYPPVPILSREALKEETFQNVRIPKGSIVIVAPWLLHRHKKLWRKPDHFMPERFLPESDEPVSKFAYIPFSIGPRICAGMAFGLTEAILCIATLAREFKLGLKPGHVVEAECRITLRPGSSLPMQVSRREPAVSGDGKPVPGQSLSCPFHHA
ncbi:MAG: cytochrome P450 [Pseudolabrys sp.]|nr:cytochrome P450 [Pseudolabrys sp.]MDP2295233.1 cytochrome P450 [Pseudolabrys sp.]